ncbi:hypothetical protein KY289_030430 [Solanum tuberosum]|nr:hypothetical protein KY289_030430 [Solanum tuberosum]
MRTRHPHLMIRQLLRHNTTNKVKQDQTTIQANEEVQSIELHSTKKNHTGNESVEGGMDGGCQEKPTNVQEGVSKGGCLTHVLHEGVHTDHRKDLRAPATSSQFPAKQIFQQAQVSFQNCDFGQLQAGCSHSERQVENQGNQNNTRVQTAKANNIQKGAENQAQVGENLQRTTDTTPAKQSNNKSQDEVDIDTQSLEEEANMEDENSNHIIKEFGSTFQSEFQEEIQEVTDQQGLSPRGGKQTQHQTKQATHTTSASSSRPITRSKSKGF